MIFLVGIDCHNAWESNKPVESQIEQTKKSSSKQVKQSFMDIYLNTVEKVMNKKVSLRPLIYVKNMFIVSTVKRQNMQNLNT